MNRFGHFISFIFLFLLCHPSAFSQYHIQASVPDLPGDTIIFGHYFNERIMIKDTFFLDQEGKGSIQGDESLPEGMYTLYLPGQQRLDLLIGEDQKFSLESRTSDLLTTTRFTGSEENKLFYEYLNFLSLKRSEIKPYQDIVKNPSSTEDSLKAREKLNALDHEVSSFVNDLINEHTDLFISSFLKSMKEVEVPDPPVDEKGMVTDSGFQARYFKEHYFDHFDISDVRLLRTPTYERKLTNYLDNWIYPDPDSIKAEVDWLIEQSRADTLLFKYMLTTLFNYYAKSKYVGMDEVYAYIAEKYYIPEATWSDPDFIGKLRERVEKISPLLIGKKAPDVQLVRVSDDHMRAAAQDTSIKKNPYAGDFFNLHNLDARFKIVYFWEADCGHCKKSIPQLYDIYHQFSDKGLEIVAVNMLGGVEGKEKWIDFINEHGLYGWVNAWNPYDFSFREAFDVKSSNILYLLDEQNRIVAKHINPMQAKQIIEKHLQNN